MSLGSLRTVKHCLDRAVAIKETAQRLLEVDDEWFAVCYFYSAYHTVKAAFIEDAVFDDLKRLQTFGVNFVPADRYASMHRARLGGDSSGRKPGVNDLVTRLYPAISAEYARLHMASVSVRYQEGLGSITRDSVLADYKAIIDTYAGGQLKAGAA